MKNLLLALLAAATLGTLAGCADQPTTTTTTTTTTNEQSSWSHNSNDK